MLTFMSLFIAWKLTLLVNVNIYVLFIAWKPPLLVKDNFNVLARHV